MRKGVETRLDGSTLVVRIPMRFQRRGGRKRMVASDGSELAPLSRSQLDGTLVKALARAWRWRRMLDDGAYATVSEIGDAENISKSYVSRIMRLALLAPDIVEAILARETDRTLMLEKLEQPLPGRWVDNEATSAGEPTRGAEPMSLLTRLRSERSAPTGGCRHIRLVQLRQSSCRKACAGCRVRRQQRHSAIHRMVLAVPDQPRSISPGSWDR